MTTSALQSCIEAIADIVGVLSGVKQAPDYPPEKASAFPFVAVMPWSGELEFGAVSDTGGIKRGLHDIAVEVHINRKMLPLDVQKAMLYSDSVPNALMANKTLSGTCSCFERITYEMGDMGWGNIQTLGFRFIIRNIKIESNIT